jgi:hypothetical protein
MKLPVLLIASVALLSAAATVHAQVCWDENPSLVEPQRQSGQVCTPRPRGGFGFWSRATSVVGADSYTMPKYASRGYTYTAGCGLTNDFNSGPRLRHYVNYLPSMPYTHPPVYPPAAGGQAAGLSQLMKLAPSSVYIEY